MVPRHSSSRKRRNGLKHLKVEEINVIHKKLDRETVRLAFIYPNSYVAAMSGLGMKLLYVLLNNHEKVYTERAVIEPGEQAEIRTIETHTSLRHFDILAFTLQFELDYTNVIKALWYSGVPVFRKERNETGNMPVVIAGGPAVTTNPFPMAPIFDAIYIGDAEPTMPRFIELITEEGKTREEIIEGMGELPGFFMPSLDNLPVTKVNLQNLNQFEFPTAQVRPITEDRLLDGTKGYFLQITRGCSRGCAFCLIGSMWSPKRVRKLEVLQELAIKGAQETKTDTISLIGSSTADHRQLGEFLTFLNEHKLKFVLPSIRADTTQEILQQVVQAGQQSLTIAPETPSDEIRRLLNKRLTNEEIVDFAQRAAAEGIKKLKMYFMWGFPNQTSRELERLESLVDAIHPYIPYRNLTVTSTPFIPKAHTQLEHIFVDYKKTQSLMKQAEKLLRKKGVTSRPFPIKWAVIQAILSISDEEMAKVLYQVARRGGSLQAWREVTGNVFRLYEEQHKRMFTEDTPPWWKIEFTSSRWKRKPRIELPMVE